MTMIVPKTKANDLSGNFVLALVLHFIQLSDVKIATSHQPRLLSLVQLLFSAMQ